MRIAMVSEHASPLAELGEVDAGGQNVHVAALSEALVARGHEVVVYTRRDDRKLPERVRAKAGYEVVHVPAGPAEYVPKDELLPFMGEFARFLAADWCATPPDVVHAHFWMSGFAAVMAARDLDVPVVQTFHALGTVKRRYQHDADTSPPQRIAVERIIGKKADLIAATCDDEVNELVRMGIRRTRTAVVPCGVDPELFHPAPASPRPRRIVSVGRLVPRKGFEDLITALQTVPDAELLIAGGPPSRKLRTDREAQRLLAHAEALGVRDRVRLVGQVARKDMPDFLRSADVVACVPWYEPFGIVPLEAMACGLPVVASAVGGLLDTVVDGITGKLVPPRDPKRLAKELRALLADRSRRNVYGTAGADRVSACFTWGEVARRTEHLYLRVARPSLAMVQ
ncbi:Glycosyltransferase involved in cell wall bisynthesis [Lentzea albidocapillata subsp. violacea]|uniref:Glycosyltransferase involved in cell wall bisynthesis n=1 Tax=Lentzea albidocapillata subsp. violacea TaxID=128104 RepID=A0A1G8UAL2_9PSEU|nr:glycosyltransferase [Lentzea albidocapillata]SDJ50782.1 Glycosyltransferase involved in cell wall bisynthesis [Lentzea albidocapillata subsp. violacea]